MTKCPPEFYECLTEEQYDEILDILDENELAMPSSIEEFEDQSEEQEIQIIFVDEPEKDDSD